MERLLLSAPYRAREDGTYHPAYVGRLVKNFRSHPSLLSVPAKLFYNSNLVPRGPKEITDIFLGWDALPNKKCPLVFHGVLGQHLQEGSSPSFFNPQEIDVTVQWVDKVLGARGKGIGPRDIGVIAPYARQVQHIRRKLEGRGLGGVRVGTVEAFQVFTSSSHYGHPHGLTHTSTVCSVVFPLLHVSRGAHLSSIINPESCTIHNKPLRFY